MVYGGNLVKQLVRNGLEDAAVGIGVGCGSGDNAFAFEEFGEKLAARGDDHAAEARMIMRVDGFFVDLF